MVNNLELQGLAGGLLGGLGQQQQGLGVFGQLAGQYTAADSTATTNTLTVCYEGPDEPREEPPEEDTALAWLDERIEEICVKL